MATSDQALHQALWFKCLLAGAAVLLLGITVHALVPEPPIPAHSHPMAGDVLVNRAAGERIVFRQVPKGGADGPSLIDVHLAPHGAIPVQHVHPSTDEVFRVLQGKVRLVVEGKIHELKAGESITVPAGQTHGASNQHDAPAHVEVAMEPTGGLNMAMTQVHGFLDQSGDSGGLTDFLQMLRFAERYEVYRADLPIWFQKLGITLVAPFARALGFRSFYATYSEQARARNTTAKDDQ